MVEQNRHVNEIAVRHQLEGSLKVEFDETYWDVFVADGYVEDYLVGRDGMDWEVLKGFAKTVLERQHKHTLEVLQKHGMLEEVEDLDSGGGGDTPGLPSIRSGKVVPSFAVKLTERERKRGDVLLEISMRKAAERPDVKRFRDERLGGQRILYDEAEAFVSPGGLSEEITDRELADLARRLERDYGWHRNGAAWFVLNGARPRLQPLITRASANRTKHGLSNCKITIQVAPWIPSEEVKKAFLQARDYVRRGSGPGTVGERQLEVLRFVEEQHDKDGRRPSFETLLKKWNQEYPYWKYEDYRTFSKTYRRACKEVVYPDYR